MKRLIIVAVVIQFLILTSAAWGETGYSESWSLDTGTQIPGLELSDQRGEIRTLSNLTGERGLLLFFNRSAVW